MYFNKRFSRAVWAVSSSVTLLVLILIILQGQYRPIAPYIIPINMRVNNAILLCILIMITPPAIIELNNTRWHQGVEKNIPRLMMDITESIRSGMPMVKALEVASTRDYGPISQILETTVVNYNLTSDLDKSLKWFGDSLLCSSGKRMANILMEAFKSGGRMMDVLDTSINMFTNIDEYREEKQSNITPYILLVYVSTLIFLFIGWVIISQFLGPLVAKSTTQAGATAITGQMLDINYYKSIIYWAAIMEGLVGGLVAGKITNSKIASGLIHSVILLVIAFGFYAIFLP